MSCDWDTSYGSASRAPMDGYKAVLEMLNPYDHYNSVWFTTTYGGGTTAEQRLRRGHSSNDVTSSGWRPVSSYERSVRRVNAPYREYNLINPATGQVTARVKGHAIGCADNNTSLGDGYREQPIGFPPNYAASNEAAVECLEGLKDGKAELGLALAGSVKAFEGLVETFTRSIRFLSLIKRGQLYPALSTIIDPNDNRRLAKDYLKFQYHWRPLASDVWDAYHLLSYRLAVENQHMSAYGSTKVERRRKVVTYNGGQISRHEQWEARVIYICKCWAKIDSAVLRAAAQTGLANPLSIAWDVLPWSFAVDWLIPVGRTIGILDATRGLSFLDGYTAVKGRMTATGGIATGADATHEPLGDFPYVVTKESYVRSKLGDFPRPLPWIRNPFSTERAFSALALFTTLRSR